MNWQHLRAIVWLRWRMSLNQLKRGGIASKIILALLAVVVVGTSATMFCVALAAGMAALPHAPPEAVMFVWDGIVLAFLMFWMIGLATELQRSEVLSLQKLLHLPVSLAGTFVINYLGSLVSVSLVVFFPAMIGLCIALVAAKGPAMLLVFPLLASFLLLVTAITYQFQGWLAALMVNPRRRRTIIVVVTMVFVLFFQLPNLLNVVFSRHWNREDESSVRLREDLEQLNRKLATHEIDADQYATQREELLAGRKAAAEETGRRQRERFVLIASRLNLFLPIGWLPYGAMACADGNVLPALLGTLGGGLIGTASLWRSYRTILRLYTGQFTSGTARPEPVRAPVPVKTTPADVSLLERRLPWLSEHASAIALGNFRSLTRAPEAKMLLISPVIMVVVFGSMFLTRGVNPPEFARPFMGFGAIAMSLLPLMQLMGNQFGLDRDGFRVLVLSCAPRRDILFGKTLSIAPLALVLGTVAAALLQVLCPQRITHFLATLAELAALFLACSVIGNFTSILAPMPIAAGSLRPAHPKAMTVIISLLFFFLFPILFGLAMIPLGVELLLHHFGRLTSVPIYFIAAWLQLAVVVWIYRFVLGWQGRLLQEREQKILAVVTSKVE